MGLHDVATCVTREPGAQGLQGREILGGQVGSGTPEDNLGVPGTRLLRSTHFQSPVCALFSLPASASWPPLFVQTGVKGKGANLFLLLFVASAKGAYTYTLSSRPNSRAAGVSHLPTGRQPPDSRSGARRGARTCRPLATLKAHRAGPGAASLSCRGRHPVASPAE